MDEPRKRFAAMMSGLDIHYDLGEGHPLLGRRMPDLDLVTANGPLRVFTLLHDARPVLLNLGEPGGFDITPWADRVQLVDAKYVGTWELPALGRGHCSHRRVDSARRICGVGGRPDSAGARRRANHLVRTARDGVTRSRCAAGKAPDRNAQLGDARGIGGRRDRQHRRVSPEHRPGGVVGYRCRNYVRRHCRGVRARTPSRSNEPARGAAT